MKHKYLATLKQDWYPDHGSSTSFFEKLQADGLGEEYEYSTKDRNIGGKVFLLTYAKEKYLAVATNTIRTWTTRSCSSGKIIKKTQHRVMLRLTDEGAKFIRELLVEENI